MENIINELRSAFAAGLHQISLTTSFIIPDICSALESENGQTNGTKYKAWFDKYVATKYSGNVSGDDIYKIRCASLHQGKLNHDFPNYEKILFQVPEPNGNIFHNNVINNALNLNVEIFVSDIISGYEQWKIYNVDNQTVKDNLVQSIKLYPNGLAPYMVGMPLLC